ncbi:hypothetical protein KUCAC02_021842, partial [Chaenocephalus aceratus]
ERGRGLGGEGGVCQAKQLAWLEGHGRPGGKQSARLCTSAGYPSLIRFPMSHHFPMVYTKSAQDKS